MKKYGEDVYVGELDEVFTLEIQEKVRPHGIGKMYKEDGSTYIGHFVHGKAHGKGVYIFNNGSFYDGQFINNKADTGESEGHFES